MSLTDDEDLAPEGDVPATAAPGARDEMPALPTLELAVRGDSLSLALIDRAGRLLDANAAFLCSLSVDADAYKGEAICQCLGTLEDRAHDQLAQLVKGDAAGAVRLVCETRALSLSLGQWQPENHCRVAALTPLGGDQREHLRHSGTLDPLTGLGNRVLLRTMLKRWQTTRACPGETRTMLMIDLDRFKQVNDTLGHPIGDDLLVQVSRRLQRAVGEEGTVLRLGGDEMMVLMQCKAYPQSAEQLGRRIIKLVGRTFLIKGHQIDISASIGIACLEPEGSDTARLLMHADLALYAAKSAGRNRLHVFEPGLEMAAHQRREMEIRLRKALVLDEFRLLYQPQVGLDDRSVSGFEALIRWHSPEDGIILPDDFIPLAEEIGEIHAIGEWVIRTACRQATEWDSGHSVAVNISPLQLEDERLIEVVRSALNDSGLPPARLELEITESALINNDGPVLERLWALRRMGVCIAMDDFGTGYSSLGYLKSFPFSRLKIDKSFIDGIPTLQSRALVEAILVLARQLGMTTVAEGVETIEQFEALLRSGCIRAQGYLFARPMPPEAISDYCLRFAAEQSVKAANSRES